MLLIDYDPSDTNLNYPYPLTQIQVRTKLTRHLEYAPHPQAFSLLWNELTQEKGWAKWQDKAILTRYEQIESWFLCCNLKWSSISLEDNEQEE